MAVVAIDQFFVLPICLIYIMDLPKKVLRSLLNVSANDATIKLVGKWLLTNLQPLQNQTTNVSSSTRKHWNFPYSNERLISVGSIFLSSASVRTQFHPRSKIEHRRFVLKMWSVTCTSLVKSRYALREREREQTKSSELLPHLGRCSFQFPALIEIKSVYANLFWTIHLFPTDETEQTSRNSVFLWQMFRQVRFISSTYVLIFTANIHYATNAGMNDLDSFRLSLEGSFIRTVSSETPYFVGQTTKRLYLRLLQSWTLQVL